MSNQFKHGTTVGVQTLTVQLFAVSPVIFALLASSFSVTVSRYNAQFGAPSCAFIHYHHQQLILEGSFCWMNPSAAGVTASGVKLHCFVAKVPGMI